MSRESGSIMQSGKCCYITGESYGLHKHHVFGGIRRRASEEWGCWVWLRGDWHNLASYGVHFDRELDARLKAECQRQFEALHGHDCFMAVFGKNYLDEEEWTSLRPFSPYEGEARGAGEPLGGAGSFRVKMGSPTKPSIAGSAGKGRATERASFRACPEAGRFVVREDAVMPF